MGTMDQFITKLSSHFMLREAVKSDTAERLKIDNTPPTSVIATMRETAMEMEIVRAMLGTPIEINSWYRCLPLNKALGSKDTSQHVVGEAVDFVSPKFGIPKLICKFILDHAGNIPFDQLILEHSWVHISFAIRSGQPRKQVLSLLKNGHYAQGLTDPDGKPYY
jgi:putative chitinase